jgi:NAD(P)-dependent dehydrogenase (short-subunit alcohol dehydrogenase family)
MGRFDGQVAIVTGAGGGIGRAHALLLAREGAQVVVNDYGGDTMGLMGTSEPADRVVTEIAQHGGKAVADAHDVALDAAAIVATALDAFGRVDIVVNNAGISGGGPLDAASSEQFDRMLDIHLRGSIAVCRAAWGPMKAQGYGRIVNTSSGSVFGLPGTPAYITAKAGLFGLTRALGHDGKAVGIAVNAIMPAAYTRMTAQSPEFAPIMQAGFPPEHIAPFVGALCSREVPCTGETFVVGGGRAARVVLATVPGSRNVSTIDECLSHFDEILSLDGLVVPADAVEEVMFECAQIGLDLRAFAG